MRCWASSSPSRAGSFNSSVGILLVHAFQRGSMGKVILLFQFLSRNSSRSRWAFVVLWYFPIWGFNSSVGILLVHAILDYQYEFTDRKFQFLSRNSSRSRATGSFARRSGRRVSIPQSEFFSFTPRKAARSRPTPRGFNSSVGILLVHAILDLKSRRPWLPFQFLSRNSSRSRASLATNVPLKMEVSIPQSEFFSFTPSRSGASSL